MPHDLPLHDGSRWNGDAVVDADDGRISVLPSRDGRILDIDVGSSCYAVDALAVLTKAGLNPYAERCRELETRLRELANGVMGHSVPGALFREANKHLKWLDGDRDG